MSTHFLSKIESRMPNLSKGQRAIADYIINHYENAAFITAAKLGAAVGVSESTVVRFAVELGYDGYPKMQSAIQEMLRDKLTSVQRIEITKNKITTDNALDIVLEQDIEKIRRTLEETSREDFRAAVKSIVSARNIYIFAVRSSSALANFLGYYFELIFENVRVINTTGRAQIYEKLFRIDKNDVMIGISFPRYSSSAVQAMRFAKDAGASVIAITDSLSSPLVGPADHVLLARSDMASVVDSLVAPLSLINALIAATVVEKKDDVIKTFNRLEGKWDEYEIYLKHEEEI